MREFLIFLIIYGILFLICFIWFVTSSILECERKNEIYFWKSYRVDYLKCFAKALFFPITLLFIFVAAVSAFISTAISKRGKKK